MEGRTEPTNDIKKKLYEKHKDHHDIIDKFDPDGLAYEINCILLKIEKSKKAKMEKIKRFLLDELKEAEGETGDRDRRGEAPNGTGK